MSDRDHPSEGLGTSNPMQSGSTPDGRAIIEQQEPTLAQALEEIKAHAVDVNALDPHPLSPFEEEDEEQTTEKVQMRAYLKIKVKSLAAEAKIIRREELKYKRKRWGKQTFKKKVIAPVGTRANDIFWGLHGHRINDVRHEARSSCLAYGFLRGRSYAVMEAKCYSLPNFKRVEELAIKYGEGDIRQRQQKFAEWLADTKKHLEDCGWTIQGQARKDGPSITGFLKRLVS